MDTNFLSMGRRPRDARLSALHIHGLFDENEAETTNLGKLATDMQALSDYVWEPNLDLTIEFCTNVGFSYYSEQAEKALRSLPGCFHEAWKVLRPWITQAEARGARVKLMFFTRAKEYRYMNGRNSMLNSEAEWEKNLIDELEAYVNAFVLLPVPSRWQTFRRACCGMMGWCWEKLPECVQTLLSPGVCLWSLCSLFLAALLLYLGATPTWVYT
jgi:hypothetical protein